jgi:hypothetical protein
VAEFHASFWASFFERSHHSIIFFETKYFLKFSDALANSIDDGTFAVNQSVARRSSRINRNIQLCPPF